MRKQQLTIVLQPVNVYSGRHLKCEDSPNRTEPNPVFNTTPIPSKLTLYLLLLSCTVAVKALTKINRTPTDTHLLVTNIQGTHSVFRMHYLC